MDKYVCVSYFLFLIPSSAEERGIKLSGETIAYSFKINK